MKKIAILVSFALLITAFATLTVTSDYEPTSRYDIGIRNNGPLDNITIGDTFNLTVWVNTSTRIDSFILYNLTWLGQSADLEDIWIAPPSYWDFSAEGTVNNDSGYLNNPQGFNYSSITNENMSLIYLNFTSEQPARCRINVSSFMAKYEGTAAFKNHTYNYTIMIHPNPTTGFDVRQRENRNQLNWTFPSYADMAWVYANTTTYQTTRTSHDMIYRGSADHYNHSNLTGGVKYYYTIWSYNDTYNLWSLTYQYANATPTGFLNITNEYPNNTAIEISRPPVNLSAYITGSHTNVSILLYNMTAITDRWTTIATFSDISNEYIEQTGLTAWDTDFIWGNTTYRWAINVSNATTYYNRSFTYTTTELADGGDARDDVNNDDVINVFDVALDWSQRTIAGYAPYKGIYDVNNDDVVNTFDISIIWANRTT